MIQYELITRRSTFNAVTRTVAMTQEQAVAAMKSVLALPGLDERLIKPDFGYAEVSIKSGRHLTTHRFHGEVNEMEPVYKLVDKHYNKTFNEKVK